MTENKIKPGDLVKHRTDSGPTMTVKQLTQLGWACTYWANYESGFVTTHFKREELMIMESYEPTQA